jgi:hypothetical protein
MFNYGCYYERLLAGQFVEWPHRKPSPPLDEELRQMGALSYGIWYVDSSKNAVARVHYIMLPDGTIMRSGLHDPKEIWRDGKVYSQYGKKTIEKRPTLIRWLFEVYEPFDRLCASVSRILAPKLCALLVQ